MNDPDAIPSTVDAFATKQRLRARWATLDSSEAAQADGSSCAVALLLTTRERTVRSHKMLGGAGAEEGAAGI